MAGHRHRKPELLPDPISSRPETIAELIYRLSEDWRRTLRLIAFVTSSLLALLIGTAIGVDIVVWALSGSNGAKSRFIYPPLLIFASSCLIVLIVTSIKKSVRRSRARRSGTSEPGG